jgi:ribonuclease-3
MSHKRNGAFNHYENNPMKQQRTYNSLDINSQISRRPDNNRNGYGARPRNGAPQHSKPKPTNKDQKYHNRDNPVLAHIERLPDPAKCEPCKLSAAETQTGMIALLDKLEAEEITPDGDRDVLHHTRELRRLLAARAEKSHISHAKKKALDEKRPVKDSYVSVPSYIAQKLEKAKELPPLPPITEPYLEEAVFTHVSVHKTAHGKGIDDTDVITYERLEFLGDAYIELFASRLIYSRLPQVDVPQQSLLREQLVKNETLGHFSLAYGLPDRLNHGGHINMKESKAWTKIVADVFEAYIAGIVLSDPEHGFQTAETWLTKLWAPQMLDFKQEVIENPQARDELQRLIMIKGTTLNFREERDMVLELGVQKYFMGLYFTGWGYEDEWLGSGVGRSKAQATIRAAMDALQKDSVILKTAAKKKQEMVQQRKEEEAQLKEADGAGETATDNVERLKENDAKATGESTPAKEGASWLEKEKRKKEKKERRRK